MYFFVLDIHLKSLQHTWIKYKQCIVLKNMTLKSHVINKDTNWRWGAIMPNSTLRHKSTKTRNRERQLWEINKQFWDKRCRFEKATSVRHKSCTITRILSSLMITFFFFFFYCYFLIDLLIDWKKLIDHNGKKFNQK